MLEERAEVPEPVQAVPPEARTIYSVLAFNGPLTRREVARHAVMAPAEIPRWLAHLTHAAVLKKKRDDETVRYDVDHAE